MDVHDDTIFFDSDPEIFEKEITGVKSNTVRVISNNEIEAHIEQFGRILITNTKTHCMFSRVISDITRVKPEFLFPDLNESEIKKLFGSKGTKIFIFSWEGE